MSLFEHMHVWLHMHLHLCVLVHAPCTCLFVYVLTYVRVGERVRASVYGCACMYVCVRVCVWVAMCDMYLHVCLYLLRFDTSNEEASGSSRVSRRRLRICPVRSSLMQTAY